MLSMAPLGTARRSRSSPARSASRSSSESAFRMRYEFDDLLLADLVQDRADILIGELELENGRHGPQHPRRVGGDHEYLPSSTAC